MKDKIKGLWRLGLSDTAKTTYLMFVGNAASAVLAFAIVVVVARFLGPIGLGLFFALYNFIQLVSSVADVGVGSGLVNFIPRALTRGDYREADQYLKAGWDFVFGISIVLTIVGLVIPFGIVERVFPGVSWGQWVAAVLGSTSFILINFVVLSFQARKEFTRSIVANLGYSSARTLVVVLLALTGMLSVFLALVGYVISSILGVVFSLPFLPKVIGRKNKPTVEQRQDLLRFSVHLGIGKIAANIASRIDVQMLFPMAGAVATAQYGIAQRVVFLYVLFSSSVGAVITPKIASISNKREMRDYAKKIILMTGFLIFGLGLGIAVADPLIPLLFGGRYPGVVSVVRWMLVATVPFLLNMAPVNIIIYFQKNSRVIGVLSLIQLVIVVGLNWFLIPLVGVYGSIIAYAVGNLFVGAVAWYMVRKLVF